MIRKILVNIEMIEYNGRIGRTILEAGNFIKIKELHSNTATVEICLNEDNCYESTGNKAVIQINQLLLGSKIVEE